MDLIAFEMTLGPTEGCSSTSHYDDLLTRLNRITAHYAKYRSSQQKNIGARRANVLLLSSLDECLAKTIQSFAKGVDLVYYVRTARLQVV